MLMKKVNIFPEEKKTKQISLLDGLSAHNSKNRDRKTDQGSQNQLCWTSFNQRGINYYTDEPWGFLIHTTSDKYFQTFV